MGWALGTASFFIIWWVLLFAVLPFGIQSQQEAKSVVPGSEPGAPIVAGLRRKLVITTIVSAAVWGVADWAYIHYYLAALN